ncbi:mercuric transport protein MerTP [Pedobacter suwonensis]|uniref:mercuric transport protein MerTP n=1 Tax=Pedobacter suwonensis TaxID=332999 RepID=UPI0036BD5CBA
MSKSIQKSWIAGLLAAFTASICCIVPLLTVIGGAGSASTYLSWVEPYRPYIIILTAILFALSWHQMLTRKPVQKDDCGCDVQTNGFMKSKKFLLTVTIISALLIAFPYYSNFLYAAQKSTTNISSKSKKLETAELSIQGMSCAACTNHIDGGLNGISGIAKSTTSFENRTTLVSYDPDSISADSISKKIRKIGYKNTVIKK